MKRKKGVLAHGRRPQKEEREKREKREQRWQESQEMTNDGAGARDITNPRRYHRK